MIRFGLMTDIQYADRNTIGKREYRDSLADTLVACGVFRREKPEFVFHLGDLINDHWDCLTAVLEILRISELDMRHVIGNHEYIDVPDDKKKRIVELLGLPESGYYSFTSLDKESAKTWRFIVLNGSEISLYAADNDHARQEAQACRERYKLPNGQLSADWNGAVSQQQLLWLDEQLALAQSQNENVIILSHFPLFNQPAGATEKEHFDPNTTDGVYPYQLGDSCWNGHEILAIMDRYDCIRAYFAGHLHEGGFGIRKNVYHVTFEGIVEPGNAFSIVTLKEDDIDIKGFYRTKSRYLKKLTR
ncbi:MAG: metallophosphoesterase [Planctomycetia bacterium]|nr:metallophosphoesterase [Planctomycetia bacterium]